LGAASKQSYSAGIQRRPPQRLKLPTEFSRSLSNTPLTSSCWMEPKRGKTRTTACFTAAFAKRKCTPLPKRVPPEFVNPATSLRSRSFRLAFSTPLRPPVFRDSRTLPTGIMAARALKPSPSAHGEALGSPRFPQKRAQPRRTSQLAVDGWSIVSVCAATWILRTTNSKHSSRASEAWHSKSGAQTILRGRARPPSSKPAPSEKAS
jgi:hypothetical protein